MKENNIDRIVCIENNVNNDILKEYVIVTNGENSNIQDTDMAEVCVFNGGACLITYIEVDKEQEIDSSSLDIPNRVGFISSYSAGKQFFSDIGYIATSKVETQRVMQIYKDGKATTSMIVIVEYYEAENHEEAWELFDKNGKLV